MTLTPPLIAIAEGRKPRPRKARVPSPRESKLHVDVAAVLRDHCLPDWKWTHINRKCKDAREGAIMKRMGVNPDWADFMLVSPHGSVRFLEVKRVGEALRPGQEEFHIWCIGHGIPHVVARTMKQVLEAFDWWGCLRIKLNVIAGPRE